MKGVKRILIFLPIMILLMLGLSILAFRWVFSGEDNIKVPVWLDSIIVNLMDWAKK